MRKTLGKYKIIEEVGRGAMGVVYRGIDPVIKRPVALKTIKKELIESYGDKNLLQRLKQEAQAAGRLQHPHIVVVYDYGEDDDTAYIAMSFVEGRPLREYFDDGERFSLQSSIELMSQLLSALSYAHEHGIVHRDIKPSNIILKPNKHIMLTDFGIARLESSELTQAGAALGTPNYMSPEQCKGETIDGRTDIFAAGVILYQFLTGKKPFEGASIASILHNIVNAAPIPPSQVKKNIPSVFDNIIEKSLAKSPEERFATAPDFGQALNNVPLFADIKGVNYSSREDEYIEKESKAEISGGLNFRQSAEKTAVLSPSAPDDPTRVLKASAQKEDFSEHENSPAHVQQGIPAKRVIQIGLFGIVALIAIVAAILFSQPATQSPSPEATAVSSSPMPRGQSQPAKIENEILPDQSFPLSEQTTIILEPQDTNQPLPDDKVESIQQVVVEKKTIQDQSDLDSADEPLSPVGNVVGEDLSSQNTETEDVAADFNVSQETLSPDPLSDSNRINETKSVTPSLLAVEEDKTDKIVSMEPVLIVEEEKQPVQGNGDSKPVDVPLSPVGNVVGEDLSSQTTGTEDVAADSNVSQETLSPDPLSDSNRINETKSVTPSLLAVEEDKTDKIVSTEPVQIVEEEKQPVQDNGDSKPVDVALSPVGNVVAEDLSSQNPGPEDTAKGPSVSQEVLSPDLSSDSNRINETKSVTSSLLAVHEEKSDEISSSKADVTLPAVSRTGTVLIQSDPVGALIYLDNKEVGVTPLEIKLVSPGVHNIKLVKNGFVAKKKSFELLPDSEKKLKIILVNNDWLQSRKKEKQCAGRDKILGLCK